MSHILSIVLLFAIDSAASAQLDRRSRDEPEMFIEAGGRTGTCDFMSFSPDGKYLYVAGDDKVIRVWPVGAQGLETGRMVTLRWPAWREQRGGIKTLALPANPADRRVAVAGFGLKNSLVVLLDADGEILSTNETEKPKMPPRNVMASAFVPDGKSIVYGTDDGKLWEWDLARTNRLLGGHELSNVKEFNRPRLMKFIDDSTFISVAQSGHVLKGTRKDGKWTVESPFTVLELFNASFARDKKKPPVDDFSVFRAAVSADGKWLACTFQPNYLVICSTDGGDTKVIRVESFVRSLAIDATGRLAYATANLNQQNPFRVEGNDNITVTSLDNKAAKIEIAHFGRAEAMAWGANGMLAVAGGDDHQVTLHDLKAPVAAKAGPLQVVRGKGRGLWDVRVGADGETVLFRPKRNVQAFDPNQRGDGPWLAFNYAVGKAVEPTEAVAVRTSADGWSVEASPKDPMLWFAVNGETRHPLKLDPDRDEQPRCYCFLPAKGDKPTRLLVGHYYGYSLFSLDKTGARRTAIGVGQAGDVTSIAASAEGTWFVTCGMDQTIAGWSLADWPNGTLGATFALQAGKLIVTEVDVGAPGWEMGLSAGDEIVLSARTEGKKSELLFGLAGKYKAITLPADTGTPKAALDALSNVTSGLEYYLGWKKGGKGEVIEGLSTVRRRPLWRFFPAFDANERFEHWVAWVWKTGHYATSTNGDYLVGWQLNDPVTISKRRPEFFLANRFKGVLNKKVAVLRLMQNRDLAATLKELSGNNPQPPRFGKAEPPPVRVSLNGTAIGPNGLKGAVAGGPGGLKADINVAANGRNPDLLPEHVELWVNDHRYKRWDAGRKPVNLTETIPMSAMRKGENEITVLSFNSAGGRGEARAVVTVAKAERQPRLYGLLVGVNDYSQTAKNPDGTRDFGNLASAKNDANKLLEQWKSHTGKGRLYEEEKLVISLDPNAYQKDILKALDKLAEEATPDDRVVIFLAGHGDFIPNPDAPKGSDEKMFVFCCPNYSQKTWKDTGVSGQMLFDRLAKCSARKLVLIDACHSGQAASENIIRHLVPEGQGPCVIAACDQKEQSYEHPKIGHGLFTAAVLEALGEKFDVADATRDKKPDGSLDPQELFAYVRDRLPSLLKETGKPERIQNPQAFPMDLARFPIARK
jgi:WD40 repeat protein